MILTHVPLQVTTPLRLLLGKERRMNHFRSASR